MQTQRSRGTGGVGSFVRGLFRRYEHRHAARQLRRLDDHLLRDIGLTRGEAERAAEGRLCRD
jgi:uncharacterized protein YjiS (DUF1127 family)